MKNKISSILFLLVAMAVFPAAALAVVPVNAPAPALTPVTINNSAGDQYDPHVSGDLTAYTSDKAIRYYNFATNADAQIPNMPIPGATWIWAPGITAATAPAELAEFFFTKSITLGATPTAAHILVAADDFAEVSVNGTVVGTTGSTTDTSVASIAANSLKSFNILPHLTAGANTITIRAQNGTGAFASCTNCTYQQQPAGIFVSGSITVGGGTVTFASDTSWQAFDGATALGSAQNVCLSASVPANCPSGATLYGSSGGSWTTGMSARDLLSDISGSKIVFSRIIAGVKTAVVVFDAATATAPVEIDPALGTTRIGSAIGGNTVAYIDFGLQVSGELVIHGLATSTSVRITNDTALDQNPSVSPNGNVVTWEHCPTSLSNCDIWQAVKSGATWSVSVVSASLSSEANPDNNGTLVVYDSRRTSDSDLFWRPVSGGAEVQLQMPGFEANPSIAGNFIAFESRPSLFDTTDIFVYDLVANLLYQITNTPLVTEQLNDITALADGRVRVVWASDEDGFDQRNIKGATFLNVAPTLSFSTEADYGTDGVNPDSGSRSTLFTYKVVYADFENHAPATIQVCIDGICSGMSPDTGAAVSLSDGDYKNGEQYTYATSLSSGTHVYYFEASDGTDAVRFPASGVLNGPSVSDLMITTTSLSDGSLGTSYSATFTATGGTLPYNWDLGGELPPGLTMDFATGTISGTPTAAGTYEFTIFVADSAGNFDLKSFTITITAPDLIETALSSPPATVTLGGSFAVTETAFNQGDAAAGKSVTRYYLSTDGVAKTKALTGSRSVPGLSPGAGAGSTGTVTVKVPTLALGTYYLLACADDTKKVVESDETNNCLAAAETVQVVGPDLIEVALSDPPITAPIGTSFPIEDVVQNIGNAAAGASTTRYYLSRDTIRDGGDLRLNGKRQVSPLGPGASAVGGATVKIPKKTPLNTYFVLGCAEDKKVVIESNETNNCLASATQITVTP